MKLNKATLSSSFDIDIHPFRFLARVYMVRKKTIAFHMSGAESQFKYFLIKCLHISVLREMLR